MSIMAMMMNVNQGNDFVESYPLLKNGRLCSQLQFSVGRRDEKGYVYLHVMGGEEEPIDPVSTVKGSTGNG